jgi:DNA-binding NarL/FixJ family response regulator
MEIRVLIADDHRLIADGIRMALDDVQDIKLVAIAKNGSEVTGLCKEHGVHVVLMDINMPVMNGVEATKLVTKELPSVRVIALSMHDDVSNLSLMVQAGAAGYLLKSVDKGELEMAIRKVHAGEQFFSAQMTMNMMASHKPETELPVAEHESLTDREHEVLVLIAQGLSNVKIAEKLFISQRTVDTHRTNIMKKIQVHNVAGIIKYAFQNNLL